MCGRWNFRAKPRWRAITRLLSFASDYGVAGQHLSSNHGVFDIRGTVNIPIFQGGSVHGDVLQADAQLQQSRDRAENLRAQIDADVRTALLNLQSSAQQVEVARSNIDLAGQTLTQSIGPICGGRDGYGGSGAVAGSCGQRE